MKYMVKRWFTNLRPLNDTENFLYFNTFTCLSLIIYLIVIFMHGGQSERAERNIYLSFFTAGPLLSFFLYQAIQTVTQGNRTLLKAVLFCFYGYLLIAFVLTLSIVNQRIYVMYLFCFIHFTGTVCIYRFFRSYTGINEHITKIDHYYNKLLFLVFPSLVMCFSTLFNNGIRKYLIETITGSFAFQVGLLGCLLILCFVFAVNLKTQKPQLFNVVKYQKSKSVLTFAICLIIPFLLFDINLYYSESNYNVYLGPAAAVLGGHFPLVDIHCMYGLSYLLFSFLFKFFLPPSYTGAAAIVSLLNVTYYITFLLIVRRISKQSIFIVALGVLAIFFSQLVMPHNIVLTPSVAGPRFLPPLLLLFAVIMLPDRRTVNLWTVLISALCVLWSFESLVYGFITYAAFIVQQGLLEKTGWRQIFKQLVFLFVGYSGIYALVASFIMILSGGKLPDFKIYFDMISAHTSSTGREAWSWSLLADPTYLVWVLFFIVYALVFVYSLRCIGEVNASKRISFDRQFLRLILPAAILGALELTYFLGRSMWAVLLCTIFPFFIILLGVLHKLLNPEVECNNSVKHAKYSAGYVGVVIAIFLIIPFSTGFTIERFLRPMEPSISNSTLIRSLVDKNYRVSDIPQYLSDNLFNIDNRWNLNFAGYPDSYRQQFNDARRMMQKWMPYEQRIIIFLPQTTHLLLLSQKSNKFPVSEDVIDQLSGRLVKKIVNSDITIKEGDVIIVTADLSQLASLSVSNQPVTVEKVYNLPAGHGYWWQTGYLILHRIMQVWDLYIIERTENVIVCRVSKKGVPTYHCQEIKFTLE